MSKAQNPDTIYNTIFKHSLETENVDKTSKEAQNKLKLAEFGKRAIKASFHSIEESKKEDQAKKGAFPVDADVKKGSDIFTKLCSTCHHLSANSKDVTKQFPGLGNIYGRIVGGDSYYNYSPIFGKLNFRWNKSKLSDFLRNPAAFIY